MVMLVITILYCISLSVIRTINRHTFRAAARAEVKSIEVACKQYYAHYLAWPRMTADNGENHSNGKSTTRYVIDRELMEILSGTEANPKYNPDKIIFMEFPRIDKDGYPLNPWGSSNRFKVEDCRYYVEFDTSLQNYIDISHILAEQPANFEKSNIDEGYQRRGVVVWTYNPEIAEGKDGKLIGSWLQ